MHTGSIGFHLDEGECPEVTAEHHSSPGRGYVQFGGIAIHGHLEDLAATLTAALTAVAGLMVDDLLAAFDETGTEVEA